MPAGSPKARRIFRSFSLISGGKYPPTRPSCAVLFTLNLMRGVEIVRIKDTEAYRCKLEVNVCVDVVSFIFQ